MALDPLKHQHTKARKLELAHYKLVEALKPLAHWSGSLSDEEDRERLNELMANARKTLRAVSTVI